jgi:hypothetical protein
MLFEPDSFSALAALEVLYTCPGTGRSDGS